MNDQFDVWEFPEACSKCKRSDNGNINEPITYLDVKTRLCEFCFDEKFYSGDQWSQDEKQKLDDLKRKEEENEM